MLREGALPQTVLAIGPVRILACESKPVRSGFCNNESGWETMSGSLPIVGLDPSPKIPQTYLWLGKCSGLRLNPTREAYTYGGCSKPRCRA